MTSSSLKQHLCKITLLLLSLFEMIFLLSIYNQSPFSEYNAKQMVCWGCSRPSWIFFNHVCNETICSFVKTTPKTDSKEPESPMISSYGLCMSGCCRGYQYFCPQVSEMWFELGHKWPQKGLWMRERWWFTEQRNKVTQKHWHSAKEMDL